VRFCLFKTFFFLGGLGKDLRDFAIIKNCLLGFLRLMVLQQFFALEP
jgi:hypothetical protein